MPDRADGPYSQVTIVDLQDTEKHIYAELTLDSSLYII